MAFELASMLALFSLLFWIHWRAAKMAIGPLILIDLTLAVGVVHSGNYWAIFPRGQGYWTENRILAYIVLVFAIVGPVVIQHCHRLIDWHYMGGRERYYRAAHAKGWIDDATLATRLRK